jgi:hypothetical protein
MSTQGFVNMAPIWRQAIAACDSVIGRLDKTGLAHQRPFVIGLTLAAVAIFIAAPDYRRFQPYAGVPWAAAAIEWKFSHPLQPIPVEEFAKDAQPGDSGVIEHLEKRSYRIAVPFISNALHIGITGALIGQQFASYLFLIFAVLVARRVIPDALCGLLVGLLFATSFIGQWGFNDFVYSDGLAYLAIMLMLWAKPPIIVLLAAFIGPLIDEAPPPSKPGPAVSGRRRGCLSDLSHNHWI